MVSRKPVIPSLATPKSNSSSTTPSQPPYPTSPPIDSAKSTGSGSLYSADLKNSPAFDLIDVGQAQQRQRSDSDASSHGTWDSDGSEDRDHQTPEAEEVEVPKPLQIRPSSQDMRGATTKEDHDPGLPAILRVGPSGSQLPRKSLEGQRYEDEAQSNPWAESRVTPPPPSASRSDSNNPYLRRTDAVVDNSQSEWQEVKPPPLPGAAPPPVPSAAPPLPPPANAFAPTELPAVRSPPASDAPSSWLSKMSLNDERPASWETAEVLPVPPVGQAPLPPPSNAPPYPINTSRPESTWWQESTPAVTAAEHTHGQSSPYPNDSAPAPRFQPPPGTPPSQSGPLIDHEEPPKPPPRVLEPINTQSAASSSSAPAPDTPGTQLKKQRNQHYQIKHVRWLDSSDGRQNMRQSPILTQNANGPCPLLALVNALVLSTPSHLDTALVETLRAREQISLGLLLDAVFDELMSGRRSDASTQLPDVGELYSFLLALHTGMNVNPRFVTPTKTPRGSLDGRPVSVNGVHPMYRAQRKAGVFEETREMRLYSTFNIPLIHGWIAPPDSPAYEAFVRSAQTFEDAQNIQFLEAELENKLRAEGLPPQEQQLLQDIQTIKAFLGTWPTQLTEFGLQMISESLAPGQFAILFRNDHFSTLYKEPKHGALMTLVTDAGYASHDEIVWESLVDVNGAAAEMFSGDFRVVSHDQDARLNQGNSAGGEAGWETVPSRGRNSRTRTSNGALDANNMASETPPPLPGPRPTQSSAVAPSASNNHLGITDEAQRKASEQEDHDLALALQLQEEEEDQQRQAEERRRREQELSERYLSHESEGPRPAVPPRRMGGRTGAGPTTAPARSSAPQPRPGVNRPSDNPSDPEAPPSYEQAASDQPYRPAGSTAAGTMAQGNPLGAYDALRRQQTASSPISAQPPTFQNRRRSDANRLGRRQSSMAGPPLPGSYAPQQAQRVNQAPGVKDAEERCLVM